jgi:hypothetical protein
MLGQSFKNEGITTFNLSSDIIPISLFFIFILLLLPATGIILLVFYSIKAVRERQIYLLNVDDERSASKFKGGIEQSLRILSLLVRACGKNDDDDDVCLINYNMGVVSTTYIPISKGA